MHNKIKAGIATRAAQRDEEIKQLRSIVNLDKPTTEETFGLFAPQEVRDQMAASTPVITNEAAQRSTLIKAQLNFVRALTYLGFKIDTIEMLSPKKATIEMGKRIFGTPGCQAILEDITQTEIAPTTDALIKRLKRSAMGEDDKVSNTAASVLAKLMGLNKEKPIVNVDARSQNLFLVGQKGADKSALEGGPAELSASDFLTHEPGEPERIFEVAEGT